MVRPDRMSILRSAYSAVAACLHEAFRRRQAAKAGTTKDEFAENKQSR